MDPHLQEFTHRLQSDWLPAYCKDAKRQYDRAGFKPASVKVTPEDARDFLRALDAEPQLVWDLGGCRFRAHRSACFQNIFWEGPKAVTPRSITLSMEPVITIAWLARLHLDFGWPKECLGTESKKWEFDLVAHRPHSDENEYLAGEIKKTRAELEEMLNHLRMSCDGPADRDQTGMTRLQKNAHKKYLSLVRRRVRYFLAASPGGLGRLFEVNHEPHDALRLNEVPLGRLRYAGK